MIAEVPSRIAFATSLASARVGSACSIIDSSICVAVITGLPASRQRRMIRFCSSGTVAAPISTPRSPRATITASASSKDLLERLDRLCLLDLRDHAGRRAVLPDDRLQVAHVGRGAHERERDEVGAQPERELEIVEVLLRQRRDRHRDAGQVDALVGPDLAADDDATARAAVRDLLDRQADEPVVDQDVMARPQHLADHRRRDRQLAVRPHAARRRRRPPRS